MAQGAFALIHVWAALVALPSGLAVVLLRKGGALHRCIGLVYVFAMLALNLAALAIYHLTGHFDLFHGFAILSLIFTLLGLTMPIFRPSNWRLRHARWMSWSVLSLLGAALNEAAIRLPLHVDRPARIIGVGMAIAMAITVAGFWLYPRLSRAVSRLNAVSG